ncbi:MULTISPECIES: hypothetical protein [Methylobacterium]|uniref:hypothetical protein n=1 Tax=Methylobacterium TaxID=407 RepID=UPI0013ED12DB|nr:hypothetical protein [Methylobacterium sp. DB0501]NGM34754.1 hypothetical protein [Methylobacterium sp. DB0501]
MRDGVHDGLRGAGDGTRPALAHALAHVRAACRRCGFPVHGFLNGSTCVLQVDGRALRDACCEEACRRNSGPAAGPAAGLACAGLQEAVRTARQTRRTP